MTIPIHDLVNCYHKYVVSLKNMECHFYFNKSMEGMEAVLTP